jgi:hypothetical protein
MDDAAPIFISYRRSDAAGRARALHEYLSGRFGPDRVFLDRSTIEGGNIFTDKIREGVEGCAALLALIAPDWLEVKGADGSRRLENPADCASGDRACARTGQEGHPGLVRRRPGAAGRPPARVAQGTGRA